MRTGNEGTAEVDMMAARLNPNGTPDTDSQMGAFLLSRTGTDRSHEQANALGISDGKDNLAGTHLRRLLWTGNRFGFPILAPIIPTGRTSRCYRGKCDKRHGVFGSGVARDNSTFAGYKLRKKGIATMDFSGGDDNANLSISIRTEILWRAADEWRKPLSPEFALAGLSLTDRPSASAGGKEYGFWRKR